MLDDDKPIMDGRWGDEAAFQEHKEFDQAASRDTAAKRPVRRAVMARENRDEG